MIYGKMNIPEMYFFHAMLVLVTRKAVVPNIFTSFPNDAFNRNIESDGSDTCELCINESVWNIHDCFIDLR